MLDGRVCGSNTMTWDKNNTRISLKPTILPVLSLEVVYTYNSYVQSSGVYNPLYILHTNPVCSRGAKRAEYALIESILDSEEYDNKLRPGAETGLSVWW